MQLSQSIKLRQKQSLVMTPQLQQAIKLLQMTNLELSQHLQEQMYDNPFLEVTGATETELSETAKQTSGPADSEVLNKNLTATEGQNDVSTLRESAALADDPTQNQEIENRFDTALVDMPTNPGVRNYLADNDFDPIDSLTSEDGFYPMLFKQMNLAFSDPADRIIATHFINALEPSGWIGNSVEALSLIHI